MNIGIWGAGNIGSTLGSLWARAGHRVMLSSRHPGRVEDLVEGMGPGVSAGSVEQAAEFGKVVLLAIPMNGILEAAGRAGDRLGGKLLIDAMNYFPERDAVLSGALREFGGPTSAYVQSLFPGAALVKAFNTIFYQSLRGEAGREGKPMAVPVAGDDPEAKRAAAMLVADAGFDPCDVGGLDRSRVMEPGALLWLKELTLEEMTGLLNAG